jgi:uncharacterized RDD family membrane protein YckC
MRFAKFYAAGASVLILLTVALAGQGKNEAAAGLAAIEVLWSFLALARFQRAGISPVLPVTVLLLAGAAANYFLLDNFANGMLSRTLANHLSAPLSLEVLHGAAFVVAAVLLALSTRLFFQLNRKAAPPCAALPDAEKISAAAGFWRRLAATVVDGVILGSCLAATCSAIFGLGPDVEKGMQTVFIFGFLSPFAGFTQLLWSIMSLALLFILPEDPMTGRLTGSFITTAVISVSILFYFVFMESSIHQGTPGKMLFGLRVTDQGGGRLSIWQAIFRNVMKSCSLGSFCLGYAYTGISPTGQGLHDLVSRSLVLRKNIAAKETADSPANGSAKAAAAGSARGSATAAAADSPPAMPPHAAPVLSSTATAAALLTDAGSPHDWQIHTPTVDLRQKELETRKAEPPQTELTITYVGADTDASGKGSRADADKNIEDGWQSFVESSKTPEAQTPVPHRAEEQAPADLQPSEQRVQMPDLTPSKGFARVYVVGSIALVILSLVMMTSSFMEGYAGLFGFFVWAVWSLVILGKLKQSNLSVAAPAVCLTTIGVLFLVVLVCSVPWAYSSGLNPSSIGPLAATICFIGVPAFFLTSLGLLIQVGKAPSPASGATLQKAAKAQPEYAPFGRRLAAVFIDGSVVGLCDASLVVFSMYSVQQLTPAMAPTNMPLAMAGGALFGFLFGLATPLAGFLQLLISISWLMNLSAMPGNFNTSFQIFAAMVVSINLASMFYHALMESSHYQATFGKLIMGLRVTTLAGKRLSLLNALARYILKCLSLSTFCLGYILIGLNPTRQGLHDLLSRCLVIRRSSASQEPVGKAHFQL